LLLLVAVWPAAAVAIVAAYDSSISWDIFPGLWCPPFKDESLSCYCEVAKFFEVLEDYKCFMQEEDMMRRNAKQNCAEDGFRV